MMRLTRRDALLLCALVGIAPARAQTAAPSDKLPVMASFSILADFVRQVGGDGVEVGSLIGPDADAHGFEPSPADAGRLARARLVIVNGLGFEGWMGRLVVASGTKATVVKATTGIQAIEEADHGHGHGHGHDHGHSHGSDPHAFQSIPNARVYVTNIRDALIAADPAGKQTYGANAERYLSELKTLDEEVRAELGRIPKARRRVITDHDAFAYYGKAYGLAFVAPRGVAKESDVSARDLARIVRQIKAEKIPALFFENVSDPRLIEQIARESGARIGGKLYSDALSGPDGPAPSYAALMRHNAKTLAAALAE